MELLPNARISTVFPCVIPYLAVRTMKTSIQNNAPPPPHRPPKHLPQSPPAIRPRKDRNRPPLPLAIPVQRYRHRAHPRAHTSAQAGAKDLIDGHAQRGDGEPLVRDDAVDVDELRGGEEGNVRAAEEGV